MMTDLLSYAAKLSEAGEGGLPPVEKWEPEFCGEIDIVIKRDGTWFHEGTPIGRARLVRLFSTVLRRDGEEYFLVTPVEKMKITVEDVPFVAVLMRNEGKGEDQNLFFRTNVGDEVLANADHPLEFRSDGNSGEAVPYVEVRRRLEARIARPVFYELVELGVRCQINGSEMFGVWSDGVFFCLCRADEVFGQE